jgi:hypothetical protein
MTDWKEARATLAAALATLKEINKGPSIVGSTQAEKALVKVIESIDGILKQESGR